MREYTPEYIQSAFAKLPSELIVFLHDFDIPSKIHEISRKNRLQVDDEAGFYNEVMYIIVGLSRVDEFVSRLNEKLGYESSLIRQIVQDTNAIIFDPIHQYLRNYEPELFDEEGNMIVVDELKESGVVMEPSEIPDTQPVSSESPDMLLKSIEHPASGVSPRAQAAQRLQGKLAAARVNERRAYGTPASQPAPLPPKPPAPPADSPKTYGDYDPYHEPIE